MRRHAFSLVELLVVLGLIALLAGMLLPALTRVQRQAKSTVCKSNLRQCGYFLHMYCEENRGWMFPYQWGTNVPRSQRWPVFVFRPAAWNPAVMRCPEDIEPVEEHSYLLNSHLIYKKVRYGRTAGVRADAVIVMGEKVTMEPDYYMDATSADETEFFRVVEPFRHGTLLGSNYLYLDLHIDAVMPRQARQAIDPWDLRKQVAATP